MYTKEELESMDNAQLMGIANSLGVKVSQDDQKESVIYAILDKAAIVITILPFYLIDNTTIKSFYTITINNTIS